MEERSTSLIHNPTNNYVILSGRIDEAVYPDLVDIILSVKLNNSLNIYIDSPGGLLTYGTSLYSLVRSRNEAGVIVNTIALGYVASAAVILFLAGNQRFVLNTSNFTIHRGRWSPGQEGMDVKGLESQMGFSKQLEEQVLEILKSNLLVTDRVLLKRLKDGDWHLSSSEALTVRLATGLYGG